MKSVIQRPRKAKVAGFMRAQNLINTKNYDVRKAIKEAGISATTYYKYLDMFGDTVGPDLLEVLPQKTVPVTPTKSNGNHKTGTIPSDLDRILQENAALSEQIKLRAELSKLMH